MTAIISANFMVLPPPQRPLMRTQITPSCLPAIGSTAMAEPWENRALNTTRTVPATVTICNYALGVDNRSGEVRLQADGGLARTVRASPDSDQEKLTPLVTIGRCVTRGPATAIALASAAPDGGVLGSPTPLGGSVEGIIWVSMARISPIRSGS